MNKTPNPDDSMGLADASLWRRLAAGLYDLFLLFAVLFFFSFVLLKVMGGAEPGVDGLYLDNQGEDLVITSDEQFRPPLSGPWFDLGLLLLLPDVLSTILDDQAIDIGNADMEIKTCRPSW